MDPEKLPIGFAMALAQNQRSLERFGRMTDSQKQQFIDRTHSIRTKEEMHRLVSDIEKA